MECRTAPFPGRDEDLGSMLLKATADGVQPYSSSTDVARLAFG
jgi:hypothetical protein